MHTCAVCGRTGLRMRLSRASSSGIIKRKEWVCKNREACLRRQGGERK
jgi:hypothetical protein